MSAPDKEWKILDLLKLTEVLFEEKSISSPRLNAELLLSKTLNTERINLYTNFDKPLNVSEVDSFREKVKRRLNFEPIQYILGEAHFYGKTFRVNQSVLIPRAETELLVEKTIEYITRNSLIDPRLLEIGTGSGCISISVAANASCHIDAIDNNQRAIETAIENASQHKMKGNVNFFAFDFILEEVKIDKYDIIICNPPYISSNEFLDLPAEIREYEPNSALTDGGDGLEFYRKIFKQYSSVAKKPHILLEIGDGKEAAVAKLVNEFSIQNHIIHKDLLKIDRVLEF